MKHVHRTVAAAVAALILLTQPAAVQSLHYKEGVHQQVFKALICDDADKALEILETWRKHDYMAALVLARIYNRFVGRNGDRICGPYSGRIVPVRQLAKVSGLTFPNRPKHHMTWYVIAVGYAHGYRQQGYMLSRFPMRTKTIGEPT